MRHQNRVILISHGSSPNTPPTYQSRTRAGRLRSTWLQNRVILISHVSSSSTAPTQQPRTKVSRFRSVWRHNWIISVSHDSSPIMAPPQRHRLHRRSSSQQQYNWRALTKKYCVCIGVRATNVEVVRQSATRPPYRQTPESEYQIL